MTTSACDFLTLEVWIGNQDDGDWLPNQQWRLSDNAVSVKIGMPGGGPWTQVGERGRPPRGYLQVAARAVLRRPPNLVRAGVAGRALVT